MRRQFLHAGTSSRRGTDGNGGKQESKGLLLRRPTTLDYVPAFSRGAPHRSLPRIQFPRVVRGHLRTSPTFGKNNLGQCGAGGRRILRGANAGRVRADARYYKVPSSLILIIYFIVRVRREALGAPVSIGLATTQIGLSQ